MLSYLNTFIFDEDGSELMEYAILLGILAVSIIAAMVALFSFLSNKIDSASAEVTFDFVPAAVRMFFRE